MIITTTDSIPDKEVSEILGIVKGNTIQSKHIGSDIGAGFKQLVGAEIKGYTKMINSARDEAIARIKKETIELGADAIINLRFTASEIMKAASEVLAYGTAVTLRWFISLGIYKPYKCC